MEVRSSTRLTVEGGGFGLDSALTVSCFFDDFLTMLNDALLARLASSGGVEVGEGYMHEVSEMDVSIW